MYPTDENLLAHMVDKHSTTRWTCDYCASKDEERKQNSTEELYEFNSAEEWEDHVEKAHGDQVTAQQRPILAELNKRLMMGPLTCPLCDFATETMGMKIDDHILQHLHEFALWALPEGPGAIGGEESQAPQVSGTLPHAEAADCEAEAALVDLSMDPIQSRGTRESEESVDVNVEGGEYSTVSHAASAAGHEEMASMLLAKAADTAAKGEHHGTPLPAASTSTGPEAHVLKMDFKGISDFFGGSILFDEYKLNLEDAEARISAIEPMMSTEEESIALSLLRGLLSAAKGEFASSGEFFVSASLKARSIGDARLASRCETYEFLLFAMKAELPMLRFHDNTYGNWHMLRDIEARALDRRKQFIENKSVVWSSLTDLEKLEREVVINFSQYSLSYRVRELLRNPESSDHNLASLLESSGLFPPPMVTEAERLDLGATSRHLRQLNAEYLLAGAPKQGSQELEQLYQECLVNGDLIRAANCQLILGDDRLSPPFTSPILLNLPLMNNESNWRAQSHDHPEAVRRLMIDVDADEFYRRAFELFRNAGSTRGKAAIYIRRGCIAIAQYLNARLLEGYGLPHVARLDGWHTLAVACLESALEHYQGDGSMMRLVSAHRIVLNILSFNDPGTSWSPTGEAYDTILLDAVDIGIWAKDNANVAIARIAGLLFLEVGRLLSTTAQNLTKASLCCACARSCFRGAEDRVLELDATIQHAKLQHSQGNIYVAQSYLDFGQRVLLDAIDNQLDPLIKAVTGEDDRRSLQMLKANRVSNVDKAAVLIYANNPRATAWATQLSELRRRDDRSTIDALLGTINRLSVADTSPGTAHGTTTGVSFAETVKANLEGSVAYESDEQAWVSGPWKEVYEAADAVSSISQQFQMAIDGRRKAFVLHYDWEIGQEHMQKVLQRLDQPGEPKSVTLNCIRATVLYYLERRGDIQQWLLDAIPTMFGGRMPTISGGNFGDVFVGMSPDLVALNRQRLCQDAEMSLSLCFVAQHWELGAVVLRRIQYDVPEFLLKLETDRNNSSWASMLYIAAIEEHDGNLESSFRWLLKALDIVETSRARLPIANELFASLARLSLRFPASQDCEEFGRLTEHWDFHGPAWADEALFFLERCRARALFDLDLEPDPDMKIDSGGGDGDLVAYLARLRSDLQREMEPPRQAMFLACLQWLHFAVDARSLYELIPDDAIVVHMTPSQAGTLVLYISRNGIELARPNCFVDQRIERHVLQYLKLFQKVEMHDLPSKTKCQALLEELSDEIILPAQGLIDGKSHLIFVPSQSLNKLPFSALLLRGEPLFLHKDVSMVPSLSALQPPEHTALNVPQGRETRAAAVVYTAPLDTNPGLPRNISAAAAIEIARRLGCGAEPAHEVTAEGFREIYETSNIFMIGSGGLQSLQSGSSAWESKLEPQVLELVPLRSRAALVVFSACISGSGNGYLGDDVLVFAQSVLSSGAGAFLVTLWEVPDMALAMLMSFFFRELTAGIAAAAPGTTQSLADTPSLAACLRKAQIRLYRADAHVAKEVLEDFRAACMALDLAHISPDHLKTILNTLDAAIAEEDADGKFDYSHPFFWAPFVLVGSGGQRLENLGL
jgi:CHAT domain-containing protein